MKKILIVFGTRPEAIKMAPVVKAFKADTVHFDTRVCITAQHREMLDQVLRFFNIQTDYDLDLMKPDQNLFALTGDILNGLKPVLDDFSPDVILVHGDTTTSMVGALAGFYAGAKVGHVEAGLRTYNKLAPFPEEINRQITGRVADYHFSPTNRARENLLNEGVREEDIIVTGNTVIDALLESVGKVRGITGNETIDKLDQLIGDDEMVLVTGHRRESFGDGFLNICAALKEIAENFNGKVVYPVHLNPHVQWPVREILGNIENVKLIAPLPYEAFVWMMDRSKLIITDSGGVQEEAPSLGKPVLVMRETTERPEAVEAGTVILVGTDKRKIAGEALNLLSNEERYTSMSARHNPYGDGRSAQRIVNFLVNSTC